jgi:SRSO17 transposase
MDAAQLRRLKPELDGFLECYLPLFGRSENQPHARRFVQGLLAGGERRNVENIAEQVDGGVVRTMQKFICQGVWNDQRVLQELQRQVVELLGDQEAVLNVDETGFPKKGRKSVGVKRQYSGTLGRVDNCQVGVFVNYCSARGHTLLDRRLFLPEEWAADRARREAAGVPEAVVFRSKPALAAEMLRNAVTSGVPFRWVGGDSVYGDSPLFVQTVRALGKWYVLDSSADARVWTQEPKRRPLGQVGPRGGRLTTVGKAFSKPVPVGEAVAKLSSSAWRRITVASGSQGPRVYEYAEAWLWFSEEGFPTDGPERLLVRRSLEQTSEVKYQRSNAPASIPLSQLARVAGCRWSVEQDFQTGKGECGLDEYETRGWTGWHHHTALSMLAMLFLESQRLRLGKKIPANDRARGPRRAAASAGPTALGRTRNPRVVALATGT